MRGRWRGGHRPEAQPAPPAPAAATPSSAHQPTRRWRARRRGRRGARRGARLDGQSAAKNVNLGGLWLKSNDLSVGSEASRLSSRVPKATPSLQMQFRAAGGGQLRPHQGATLAMIARRQGPRALRPPAASLRRWHRRGVRRRRSPARRPPWRSSHRSCPSGRARHRATARRPAAAARSRSRRPRHPRRPHRPHRRARQRLLAAAAPDRPGTPSPRPSRRCTTPCWLRERQVRKRRCAPAGGASPASVV